MANTNDIIISYIFSIFSNNSLLDFSIMSQRNKVINIANIASKAGFASFINLFIAQLCNFSSLKADGFYIVQSIMYKLELKKT